MIGIVLEFVLGIATILLGAKAFTRNGLPLARTKNLTGTPAMVTGIVCMVLGVAFIIWGLLFAAATIVNR